MKNYKETLEEQYNIINKLIKKSEKNLAKYIEPGCRNIRVSTSNGCNQYYYVEPTTGKRIYIKKNQMKMVQSTVQHDYDLIINKQLNDMQKCLGKFIKKYDFDNIKGVYDKLPKGRKDLIIPIIESDDQFIERWLQEHAPNQNSFFEEGLYETNRGEFVRSKSEKIIADALDKYGVPYQYEPSLELNGFHVVYPDYIVLNVRERKEMYWEHLGLIADMEYAEKNFRKIQEYENSGILLGRDLIVTMESQEIPLNTKIVEAKIKELLL